MVTIVILQDLCFKEFPDLEISFYIYKQEDLWGTYREVIFGSVGG